MERRDTTNNQMKMFLTRLSFNSKMITGDITQIDLPHQSESGLKKASCLLTDVSIQFVYLNAADVIRHR